VAQINNQISKFCIKLLEQNVQNILHHQKVEVRNFHQGKIRAVINAGAAHVTQLSTTRK
jgi:hypothetical protein